MLRCGACSAEIFDRKCTNPECGIVYADLSDDEFGGDTLDATQDSGDDDSEGSLRDFIVDNADEESESSIEVQPPAPSATHKRRERLDQLRADRLRRTRREPIVIGDDEEEGGEGEGESEDIEDEEEEEDREDGADEESDVEDVDSGDDHGGALVADEAESDAESA